MTWLGNPLPEGAAKEETSTDVVGLLQNILKELRMMNMHLASMTGELITKDDVTLGE